MIDFVSSALSSRAVGWNDMSRHVRANPISAQQEMDLRVAFTTCLLRCVSRASRSNYFVANFLRGPVATTFTWPLFATPSVPDQPLTDASTQLRCTAQCRCTAAPLPVKTMVGLYPTIES